MYYESTSSQHDRQTDTYLDLSHEAFELYDLVSEDEFHVLLRLGLGTVVHTG